MGDLQPMVIFGMQKTTLLDYPNHLATILFTGGCNFHCSYCHNAELISPSSNMPQISQHEIFAHLEKRQHILDGVVISGGEPTLQKDLPDFLRKIKSLSYKIKLDTNGSNPSMLQTLAMDGLLDYVAMDIKQSPSRYYEITGNVFCDLSSICESVDLLLHGNLTDSNGQPLPYEFRTTVCAETHCKEDFRDIGTWIQGASNYYLQPYQESPQVLHPDFHSPSASMMDAFLHEISPFVSHVAIRG